MVLILHGWGDSSSGWQSFGKKLAKKYEVILLDLPGFGGSASPQMAWGLTDYANFVRDFLIKLGVQAYAVIGHSNGGAIAVRGIGQGIFQTDRLVLVASAGIRGTNSNKALYVATKVGKVLSSPLPKGIRSNLRAKLYQKAGSDLLVAEHMQDTFKRIVRDDVRDDAAYISTPTLLVYGELDTATPVALGRQLHDSIEGSCFEQLAGVGHFVQLEAEVKLLDSVEEFLGA